MSIYSLTYVSSVSGMYKKDIFRDIALNSHAYNSSHGITGMLLVFNETVMQFLEGPKDEVVALYDKIENDRRHKGPIVVSTRTMDAREFPHWSMGYKERPNAEERNFIFNLDKNTFDLHVPLNMSGISSALLSSFKRSSGLELI